jgi:hypothetical protein
VFPAGGACCFFFGKTAKWTGRLLQRRFLAGFSHGQPRVNQPRPQKRVGLHPALHRFQAVPAQGLGGDRPRRLGTIRDFAVTVLVTVTTDLLIGIAAGLAVKYLLTLWSHTLALAWNSTAEEEGSQKPATLWGLTFELFRNPVARKEQVDWTYHLYCDRPLCCFNLFHLLREMDAIPSDAREIVMHLNEGVTLIDHTTCEILFHYLEEHKNNDEKPSLIIEGLERMRNLSGHESSIRLGMPTVNSE